MIGGVGVPQTHFKGVSECRSLNGSSTEIVHLFRRSDVFPRGLRYVGGDELMERFGGQRKPVGNLNTDGGKFLEHFPQRCAFSTHR